MEQSWIIGCSGASCLESFEMNLGEKCTSITIRISYRFVFVINNSTEIDIKK